MKISVIITLACSNLINLYFLKKYVLTVISSNTYTAYKISHISTVKPIHHRNTAVSFYKLKL